MLLEQIDKLKSEVSKLKQEALVNSHVLLEAENRVLREEVDALKKKN